MDENKEKLIQYLKDIKNDNDSYYAVYFNFSKLEEQNKNDYRIKIAINTINVFLRYNSIELFTLKNYDIILICKNQNNSVLQRIIFELRYFFIDDPLSFNPKGIENTEFCSTYDLREEWNLCYKDVNKEELSSNNKNLVALNSKTLASVENDILNAQIISMMRTQNIVAISKNNSLPKTVFYEIYVSISHLCDLFNYKLTINHNSLLFRHLTSKLDERVLETLGARIANYDNVSISINLNVETILSKKFYDFDQQVNQSQKKSIIIEINISDVFSDISSFMLAKAHLQKLGYRVCLDGVNNLSFIQVDRESLGFDLVKLQWNNDSNLEIINSKNTNLGSAIQRCGAHRVILCRCDNLEAVKYGQELGILLFQGWYIDKLTSPSKS